MSAVNDDESPPTKLANVPLPGDDTVHENEHFTNGDVTNNLGASNAEDGESTETIFSLTILLPHEPEKIEITVSSHEQVQEVRQSIIEQPDALQYSCFHLVHDDRRISDFVPLSDVKEIVQNPVLKLVEDPYTEKEARIHVIKVRELLTGTEDKTDTLQGILAGLTLHDDVLKREKSQHIAPETTKTVPTSTPFSGFDLQTPATLETLHRPLPGVRSKVIQSISVSPWNPPPHRLRLKGHLLYLQLITQEGVQYQITSHVSGFYVNRSTATKFDPLPNTTLRKHSAHSLLTLLSGLSDSFQSSFAALQDSRIQKDPLSTFQITNAAPASPWLVPSSASTSQTHYADITRTQESYLVSGIENSDTLRDWNEEFQSTRELPKETAQDRIFRERLMSKLFADYNEAATRGALLVARGEVAPLNPIEAKDAQIFVYNNVFFSFGADGVGTFASEGGDEAARVATAKDVMGVRMVNQLDIDGLFTPGTVVVDYLGKRIVGQSIVPGIFKQREPGENQIDYGAVDGREVIATDERFAPVFEKMSRALKIKRHFVWDKDGHRHELEGSVETKGLLGTDGRKYVLDLYRVTPLDILWMEENGTTVAGSNLDVNAEDTAYPHRMTVLRPELIDVYWKSKMRTWVNGELHRRREVPKVDVANISDESSDPPTKNSVSSNIQDQQAGSANGLPVTKNEDVIFDRERIDISKFHFALNPDAFGGQEPQTDLEKEDWDNDEREVRQAASFLRNNVLPDLIRDLQEGDVGFPMDGPSLSRLLHKRGINMRYLGVLATLAKSKRLESLRILVIQDMISRGFKHVAGRYLRFLPVALSGACIAHLLNCLFGMDSNTSPIAEIDELIAKLYTDADLAFQVSTPDSIHKEVELQVYRRYRFRLPEAWHRDIKQIQLLREVSLCLGLQLVAKDYQFPQRDAGSQHRSLRDNGDSPLASNDVQKSLAKKKKTMIRNDLPESSNDDTLPQTSDTFCADDILNVVPLVKDASPKSSLAEEALEAGRISIMQGQKKLGEELLLESLSLHEQIYGILHPEVARVYTTLSMLYYQLEEKDAAVELARKAVIVSERTLGIDSAETLLSYLNLGLFSHAIGDTTVALAYIRHALELWKIIFGSNHPDSITTVNNAAVMLQHLKCYHESRLWFEASLQICEDVFGKQSVNVATLLFQLAQALALDQDSKGAVKRMRESYNIFLAELGPADNNTKEAENWLEQLTQNAVSIAKHAKDMQTRKIRAGVRSTPKLSLGQTQTQTMVTQNQKLIPVGDAQHGPDLDSRSIDDLLKFIEGGEKSSKPRKRPGHSNPKRHGRTALETRV